MCSIRFGTDGWRGIIAADFTFANVGKVSQAIANYIVKTKGENKEVVVGYDNRFLSEQFAQKTACVLSAKGIKVLLSESPVPTPVTAYMVRHMKTAGALMITASHNPYYYNGIKFITEYAGPAHSEVTTEIEGELAKIKAVQENDFVQACAEGLIELFSGREVYLKHLNTVIDKGLIEQSNLKIVIDCLYGVGSGYIDSYFNGQSVVCAIRNVRNPLFNNLSPDPKESNLALLKEKVQTLGANLGVAFDGDADRFGIIDCNGVYYSPNQIFSLLLPYLLKTRKQKGPVYRTVATTHRLDKIAEEYGIRVVETPVGFKYIAKGFLTDNAIFGAEESGGMSVMGHIPEKDGILASILVIEMLARTKKPLHQLYSENCQKYGPLCFERLDLMLSVEDKKRVIERVHGFRGSSIGSLKIKDRINIDGRKFIFIDNSWCLIRPSGTENLVRIYMEAAHTEGLNNLRDTISHWLKMNCI